MRPMPSAMTLVKEHAGFRAVSAAPVAKDGDPVADATLVQGAGWTTVNRPG